MQMKAKPIIYVVTSILLLSCITVISVFAYGDDRLGTVSLDGIEVELIDDGEPNDSGFIVEKFNIDENVLQTIQGDGSKAITIEVGEIILNDPAPRENNFQIKIGNSILTKNDQVQNVVYENPAVTHLR